MSALYFFPWALGIFGVILATLHIIRPKNDKPTPIKYVPKAPVTPPEASNYP